MIECHSLILVPRFVGSKLDQVQVIEFAHAWVPNLRLNKTIEGQFGRNKMDRGCGNTNKQRRRRKH